MAIPTQQSSLATVPPIPVMKRTSTPSTTSYLPLSVGFPNKVLIISGDMNALIGKDEITNSANTTRQKEIGKI